MTERQSPDERRLAAERGAHDELYSRRPAPWVDEPLTWERYRARTCRPPHQGGTIYGLDRRLFAERVEDALGALPTGATVLDYGCGRGEIGILAALRGFPVFGFDVSPVSIRQARRASARAGVDEMTTFVVANAQELPFYSRSVDCVLGKAVLHHVIKYEETGAELARVMKPGGRALFLEGAAENPLLRLARRFTIEEELGDVPLTRERLDDWAAPFDRTQVTGYFLFYMLKRFGFRGYGGDDWTRGRNPLGRTRLFNLFLRGCLLVDELLVNERPWAEHVAGRFLIDIRR